MTQIIAIVKPFRAQAVLEAVGEFKVDSVLVNEAKGFGRQKDNLTQNASSEYSPVYLPKIEIRILVDDQWVESIAARIVEVARTGRIGDGKIFSLPLMGHLDF